MTHVRRIGLYPNLPLTLLVFLVIVAAPLGLGARQSAPAQQPVAPPTDVDLSHDWSDDVPAHVSIVDGNATIERDGRVDALTENVALLAGDRLRTDNGRVDILFADGSALDLDQATSVELLADEMLRMTTGRVRFTLARAAPDGYRIDSAGTTTFLLAAGEYRLAVGNASSRAPEVTLTVARGSAELSTASGRTVVRAGMAARASAAGDPSVPYAVSVSSWEPFDRWADDQRNARYGAQSSQYLPSDLQSYSGYLDHNGTWGYVAPYGNVWYPTVAAGWQPYYYGGGWSFYASFGWMWGGAGPWLWPTYHYGRWGYGSSWYWIPDNHWGPAWVSWGGSPGYVGWCPLGYNNRAVFSYAGGVAVSHGRGWAVAPAQSFAGHGRAVAADTAALGATAHSRFTEGRAPAQPAGVIARANTAPLRAPSLAPRGVAQARNAASPGSGLSTSNNAGSRGPSTAPRDGLSRAGANTGPRVDASGATADRWPTAGSRSRADVSTSSPSRAQTAPADRAVASGASPSWSSAPNRTPSRTPSSEDWRVAAPRNGAPVPRPSDGASGTRQPAGPPPGRTGYGPGVAPGSYGRPSASPSAPYGGSYSRPSGSSGPAGSAAPRGPSGGGSSSSGPSSSGPSGGHSAGGSSSGGRPSGSSSGHSRGGR